MDICMFADKQTDRRDKRQIIRDGGRTIPSRIRDLLLADCGDGAGANSGGRRLVEEGLDCSSASGLLVDCWACQRPSLCL
jgi:hypothetical protein